MALLFADFGLAAAFFFGSAFLAEALAFVVELAPVAAFLAVPRLLVVFFVAEAAALGLPASFFLVVVDLVVVDFFAGAALVVDLALVVVAFFVVAVAAFPDLAAGAFFAVAVLDLEGGLSFSLAAPGLGASLTLPEGPLGSANMPTSAP